MAISPLRPAPSPRAAGAHALALRFCSYRCIAPLSRMRCMLQLSSDGSGVASQHAVALRGARERGIGPACGVRRGACALSTLLGCLVAARRLCAAAERPPGLARSASRILHGHGRAAAISKSRARPFGLVGRCCRRAGALLTQGSTREGCAAAAAGALVMRSCCSGARRLRFLCNHSSLITCNCWSLSGFQVAAAEHLGGRSKGFMAVSWISATCLSFRCSRGRVMVACLKRFGVPEEASTQGQSNYLCAPHRSSQPAALRHARWVLHTARGCRAPRSRTRPAVVSTSTPHPAPQMRDEQPLDSGRCAAAEPDRRSPIPPAATRPSAGAVERAFLPEKCRSCGARSATLSLEGSAEETLSSGSAPLRAAPPSRLPCVPAAALRAPPQPSFSGHVLQNAGQRQHPSGVRSSVGGARRGRSGSRSEKEAAAALRGSRSCRAVWGAARHRRAGADAAGL
jgi:hypothetical protein